MKNKILYGIIAALVFICLGQAYYIYAQQDTSTTTVPAEKWADKTEKWHKDAQKRIRSGERLSSEFFDDFFNDDFFGRRYNPFVEMERLHKQMEALFRESEKTLFDNSWNTWFTERMSMNDFKTDVSRTDKNVTVAIAVPGIDKKSADININDDRIKISFTAKTVREDKKDSSVSRSESIQSYVKVLPIPEDAVAKTAKTSVERNQVKIVFDRQAVKK